MARYGEHDKAPTGLGAGAAQWAVPFWFVDAGMAAENRAHLEDALALVTEALRATLQRS